MHQGGIMRSHRERLLAHQPVTERRLEIAGVSTTLLEGGSGRPIVLLHGPGEFAGKWLRIIPQLVSTHRVIAPDLPGHGDSQIVEARLDGDGLRTWVKELIARTCAAPPVLVGHVIGGAIAARFALDHADDLDRLVLVDSLGLAPFRPAPAFALTMLGFLMRPTERTYTRLMRQCSYDLDALKSEMGDAWDAYAGYNLQLARGPHAKHAGRLMRSVGLRAIPPEDLARITVPTTLIWGRQDRANPLRIAEAASARYGWPLYIIENCADDPARDQPRAFLHALYATLASVDSKPPALAGTGAHHV
jgi:pimeloyl-ACP methyl ester carboxylesterase